MQSSLQNSDPFIVVKKQFILWSASKFQSIIPSTSVGSQWLQIMNAFWNLWSVLWKNCWPWLCPHFGFLQGRETNFKTPGDQNCLCLRDPGRIRGQATSRSCSRAPFVWSCCSNPMLFDPLCQEVGYADFDLQMIRSGLRHLVVEMPKTRSTMAQLSLCQTLVSTSITMIFGWIIPLKLGLLWRGGRSFVSARGVPNKTSYGGTRKPASWNLTEFSAVYLRCLLACNKCETFATEQGKYKSCADVEKAHAPESILSVKCSMPCVSRLFYHADQYTDTQHVLV